ncbi:hypothetical protein NQ314_001752 [Rhamnusium bicolor]|uniref:Uncharacterized protein n=1 Tax=Rhamnusium bicolor TaxID=1586634 RepID=A0AAV8ZRE4_9CUCU|nr:hypothetical protein NQ314_001752 [Rhamnusium bicolor]
MSTLGAKYEASPMHGQPFLKCGKRAAKLLIQNECNISAVTLIGKLTLGVAKLLIALVSLLLSMIIFLTAIDTIFICFCEDSLLNDGMARPYAMSKELTEFIESTKKAYGEKQHYVQFDPPNSQPV